MVLRIDHQVDNVFGRLASDKSRADETHLLGLRRQRHVVVGLVPETERCRVDHHDGVLNQNLGSHQLVVAGVVDDVDDLSLFGRSFRAPGKVTVVQLERSFLGVATASSNVMNLVRAKLSEEREGRLERMLLGAQIDVNKLETIRSPFSSQ